MNQKDLILKVLLIIVATVFLGLNAYSYIYSNGAGGGYGGNEESGEVASFCNQHDEIEYYIILSAGYYFNANNDIQQLLRRVEWQGIQGVNYIEMQGLVEDALFNMNNAVNNFDILIEIAEATPYNEEVLALLKNFDYDNFMLENGLNKVLFDVVRQYLQAGDITGIFKYLYPNYTKIIALLDATKIEVDNYKLPELSVFWQINETLADTSTIGSYIARIFAAI